MLSAFRQDQRGHERSARSLRGRRSGTGERPGPQRPGSCSKYAMPGTAEANCAAVANKTLQRVSCKGDVIASEMTRRDSALERPADLANGVLTTAVEACGQPWTPTRTKASYSPVRRPVVDALGPTQPPENRTLGGSSPSSSVVRGWRHCRIEPYWIKRCRCAAHAGPPRHNPLPDQQGMCRSAAVLQRRRLPQTIHCPAPGCRVWGAVRRRCVIGFAEPRRESTCQDSAPTEEGGADQAPVRTCDASA